MISMSICYQNKYRIHKGYDIVSSIQDLKKN